MSVRLMMPGLTYVVVICWLFLYFFTSVNVLAILIYHKLFQYFTLSKTSLKQLFIASYSKELYKQTPLLQQMKIKNAVGKNQMIFLKRFIYRNITPKSFQLKTPIKSKKAFNIMNVYKKKLIIISKNNAKETLKVKVSEEHYLLI